LSGGIFQTLGQVHWLSGVLLSILQHTASVGNLQDTTE
jgi:hypothetical protein